MTTVVKGDRNLAATIIGLLTATITCYSSFSFLFAYSSFSSFTTVTCYSVGEKTESGKKKKEKRKSGPLK